MPSPTLHYQKGNFKYQVKEFPNYQIQLQYVRVPTPRRCNGFIALTPEGLLTIKKGYAWDGASGPTFDTKSTIIASLVHDALYQLKRNGQLDDVPRTTLDDEMDYILKDDGTWWWRRISWIWALKHFAERAASKLKKRKVFIAP